MRLSPVQVRDPLGEKRAHAWLPHYDTSDLRDPGKLISVNLNGRRRFIAPRIARMAFLFNAEFNLRLALNQGCGAFAFACQEQTVDLHRVPFYMPGGVQLYAATFEHIGRANRPDQVEKSIKAGDTVLLARQDEEPNDPIQTAAHMMVRATELDAEGSEALYFSKPGAGSPVVLSSLRVMADFYSAMEVIKTGQLFTVEYQPEEDI